MFYVQRWGKCKAKKKCPLELVFEELKKRGSKLRIYVLGECANKNVKVVELRSADDIWMES